ncbi:hypothetical protein BGZ50_009101 [Haplosporangium sp. Z 11]|nr:hypothetical protein BGZ50_009101 [Haplosporangium sp. Z 11]
MQVGEERVLTIRKGTHSDYIHTPDEYIFQPVDPTEPACQATRQDIYLNLEDPPLLPQVSIERAILTPLNVNANKTNDMATEVLHGDQPTTYLA